MLRVQLRDRMTMEWIRQKTKITDMAKHVARWNSYENEGQ